MDDAFQASRMRFSANARKSDVQICLTGQDKSGLTSDTTLKRTSQAGSHRGSAGASCTRRRTEKWTVHDEALVRLVTSPQRSRPSAVRRSPFTVRRPTDNRAREHEQWPTFSAITGSSIVRSSESLPLELSAEDSP
jgi:hypothetical protein